MSKSKYLTVLQKMGGIISEDKKVLKFSEAMLIKNKNGIEYTVDYIEYDNGNVYAYRVNPDGSKQEIVFGPKSYKDYERSWEIKWNIY